MNSTSKSSRRNFLKAASVAAGAATFGVPAIGAPGGKEIQVGCIGTGGRCRTLMKSLAQIPDVRIVAVCDIYDTNLEEGRKLADRKAFTTKKYQELLDRKDVDAVVIGAPDHWHVPMTISACEAKKDVYVEKPLTHSLSEGHAVIDAQKKHQRVVQVGMQQRSMPQFREGLKLIQEGRLGKIHKVHLTWNRNTDRIRRTALNIDPKSVDWTAFLGNAPKQDFDEYRFRSWRWFWDFGGGIFTDLMVHFIDVAHWYLDLDHPAQATSIGNHVLSKGVWETPDTVQTLLSYPNDIQIYFEGTFFNARNAAMLEFMGTDATLYLDRGRVELIPEKNKGERYESVLATKPKERGQDFYDKPDGELLHLTNWVECIRSRKEPHAPVKAGVSAASAAHMANKALRSNQVVTWKD